MEKLRQKNIGATVYYRTPIHLMPYYKQLGKYKLPETEKASKQVFSLPIHPAVTVEQIDYVGKTVAELIK